VTTTTEIAVRVIEPPTPQETYEPDPGFTAGVFMLAELAQRAHEKREAR
jgi:hypothetical protein